MLHSEGTHLPPQLRNTGEMTYLLTCAYTGVVIGNLRYQTCAGYMPYLSHWSEMVALHPIFSLPRHKLLAFARSEWKRLAAKSEDEEASEHENLQLQICFMAVLHSLDSIDQTAPCLPPLAAVHDCMPKLFALAYWKLYLDSKRFSFPTYRIHKVNANTKLENVKHYLEACFAIKEDYERGVNDAVEKERLAAAERAMQALRSQWIAPASNKTLWNWVRAHIPAKWEADAQGWMHTLFCGNRTQVLAFDEDEVDLLQFIIESECLPGTAIMHAVRERIAFIKKLMFEERQAFSVDFEEYLPAQDAEALEVAPADWKPRPLPPAPQAADFDKQVLFIKAKARWMLECRAIEEENDKMRKQLAGGPTGPASSAKATPEQLLLQAIARQQAKEQLL